MNKNRTLLLIEGDPNKEIFFNDWIKNGYRAGIIFKNVSKPLRAVRRVFMKYNLPFSKLWLNKWFSNLDDIDTVIIHMNRLTRFLPKLISDKYPNIRVIGWYWNTITKESEPINFDNEKIEYWSFDDKDCEKYGLKKNIQYYVPVEVDKNIVKENDIYFIGRNKGREEQINSIENIAINYGLKCQFRVINDNSDDIIPYSEIQKDLLKTKAILEINKENQVGLTLRALESLFFGIKLITNNIHITEAPFYSKKNVYIIGIDKEESLVDFVNGEYDNSVDKYKNEYCLDKWFSNFENH